MNEWMNELGFIIESNFFYNGQIWHTWYNPEAQQTWLRKRQRGRSKKGLREGNAISNRGTEAKKDKQNYALGSDHAGAGACSYAIFMHKLPTC